MDEEAGMKCFSCNQVFKDYESLHAHKRQHSHYKCILCHAKFSSENDRESHMVMYHNKNNMRDTMMKGLSDDTAASLNPEETSTKVK